MVPCFQRASCDLRQRVAKDLSETTTAFFEQMVCFVLQPLGGRGSQRKGPSIRTGAASTFATPPPSVPFLSLCCALPCQFVKWANAVRERVLAAGHWLNFTDPASGYPVHGDRGGLTCNDVDVCLLCTKFPTVDLGVCKILSHPEWKTAVYPTTMASTAPLGVLVAALDAEKA